MRFINKINLLAVSVLFLSACANDESVKAPLHALAISGNSIALDGTYVSNCHYSVGAGTYMLLELAVSGPDVTQSVRVFDPTDSSCTGTILQRQSVDLSFSETGTTVTSNGWVDNSGNADVAPISADGLGALGNNLDATVFNITALTTGLSYTAGFSFSRFIVVDDSSDKPVLHFAHDYPTTLATETDPAYTKI